jgi:hypothetical protein
MRAEECHRLVIDRKWQPAAFKDVNSLPKACLALTPPNARSSGIAGVAWYEHWKPLTCVNGLLSWAAKVAGSQESLH